MIFEDKMADTQTKKFECIHFNTLPSCNVALLSYLQIPHLHSLLICMLLIYVVQYAKWKGSVKHFIYPCETVIDYLSILPLWTFHIPFKPNWGHSNTCFHRDIHRCTLIMVTFFHSSIHAWDGYSLLWTTVRK